MSKKVRRCVICGKVLPKGEYGNNPEPIKPFSSGVCCNECNREKVLPARNNKGANYIMQAGGYYK